MPTFELLLFAFIAVALLFADRWLRLSVVLNEGFVGNTQMCGLDMPDCPFGTHCGNGFCVSTEPPRLPPNSGLPVFPS